MRSRDPKLMKQIHDYISIFYFAFIRIQVPGLSFRES